MSPNYFETNQYVQLALERHKRLIEDARKYRELCLLRQMTSERPLRWRRVLHGLRNRTGNLLVYCGQKLKTDTTHSVWG